jgi:hypothetical protein
MRNADFIGLTVLLVFLVVIISTAKNKPSVQVANRPSPLPVNQYTNGVANGNTNDVESRKNFRQQPVGGPAWG